MYIFYIGQYSLSVEEWIFSLNVRMDVTKTLEMWENTLEMWENTCVCCPVWCFFMCIFVWMREKG